MSYRTKVMPLLVSQPPFFDDSKTLNAIKTLLSQISNSCYQKHLIVLQKLAFTVHTSTHTSSESLCTVFVGHVGAFLG